MRPLSTLLCLALLGCPTDSDSKLDTSPPGDTAPQAASLETAFSVDASGTGEVRLGGIEVQGNLATLELSGVAHRGVAYQHHDWQSTGYVLFDLLTVAEDGSNLAVTYLYEQDGQLPYAYSESFEHPMDWEVTTGSVSWQESPTVVTPDIPELTGRPEPLDVGITISGDALWLEGDAGEIDLEGATYDLLPFATVDCTDCPGGPWLELHCLLEGVGERAALSRGGAAGSNAAGKDGDPSALACFGIVYLFPNEPDHAQLSYGICLPGLETPSGDYEVSWTGGLVSAVGAQAPGPPTGRPPRAR